MFACGDRETSRRPLYSGTASVPPMSAPASARRRRRLIRRLFRHWLLLPDRNDVFEERRGRGADRLDRRAGPSGQRYHRGDAVGGRSRLCARGCRRCVGARIEGLAASLGKIRIPAPAATSRHSPRPTMRGASTCRDFLASYVLGQAQAWLQGEACRTPHGTWEVKSLRPLKQG